MKIYLCLIIGPWKLVNWRLYYSRVTHAVKHPEVKWLEWRRVL